ncbi:MAG: sensor histidine kinase [Lachnospiraceae bacterium]
MRTLTNRILLLIYCFISVYLSSFDTIFILAFFTALSITALNDYLDSRLLRIITTGIYGFFSCLYPALFLFVPLLTYDMFLSRHFLPWLPAAVSFLIHTQDQQFFKLLYVLTGIGIAALLCYQTETYNKLEMLYKKSRDDSIERDLLLKAKNRSILQNQNYEIYTATLKERNRIAREIHDNVGHLLSRSILMTGALKATNKDEALSPQLNMLDATLNQAMDTIRSSVHDLHDNSVNLRDTLDDLINSFDFCDITLTYDMQLEIPNDVKYSFISITKEALANIMKHSNATTVQVLVREHPAMYQLIIEDNGTIIKKVRSPGIGLVNIRDRVESLKGNILIETEKGFRIFITIPKQ